MRNSAAVFMREIVALVADRFGVTVEAICGKDRHQAVLRARRACYWLGRNASTPRLTYPQIAHALGEVTHQCVAHGSERASALMVHDRWLREQLTELRLLLEMRRTPPLTLESSIPRSEFDASGAVEVA